MKNIYSFLLRKKVTEKEVKNLVIKTFDVPKASRITDSNTDGIFYDYHYQRGDFKTSIEVYVEESLSESIGIKTNLEVGCAVAKYLKEDVLISDSKLNPYTWLLISNNHVYEVKQKLDNEKDNTIIIKEGMMKPYDVNYYI